MFDAIISFILGLLLIYVLATLYKPYQYQIVESNTTYPVTRYAKVINNH